MSTTIDKEIGLLTKEHRFVARLRAHSRNIRKWAVQRVGPKSNTAAALIPCTRLRPWIYFGAQSAPAVEWRQLLQDARRPAKLGLISENRTKPRRSQALISPAERDANLHIAPRVNRQPGINHFASFITELSLYPLPLIITARTRCTEDLCSEDRPVACTRVRLWPIGSD